MADGMEPTIRKQPGGSTAPQHLKVDKGGPNDAAAKQGKAKIPFGMLVNAMAHGIQPETVGAPLSVLLKKHGLM